MAAARVLCRVPNPILSRRTILPRRLFTTSPASVSKLLKISPEVSAALASNKPVVALESTIYTHGALGADLPEQLDSIVRLHGAVPAVCGVLAGVPTVGLTPAEIARMAREGAAKVSRRDLAFLAARGVLRSSSSGGDAAGVAAGHGGTTICGTMVLARLAGIRVFGTGGLGGVHRGGESSMDVSADLTELGRTRVAVVSSGCKGFLDIPRTLEVLETQGVLVATFSDGTDEAGRKGVDFPAFWVRESGVPSPAVVRDEKEAAAIILAQERLGIESGLLFANPIPKRFAISREEMESAIQLAVAEAEEMGITGSANTPYILKRIKELTQGRSVSANKALVQSNVARAAKIAVELAKMMGGSPVTPRTVTSYSGTDGAGITSPPGLKLDAEVKEESHPVDVLVAGSVALDLNCDYTGGAAPLSGTPASLSPALHTSNPATIQQSVGGVGHNIALAAHRVSEEGKVRLCSMVGDDIAGSTILSALHRSGLDTSCIRQLGHEYPSTRTAQYVAVNDAHKNLVLAMADMAIFSTHSFPAYWESAVAAAKPKWLVVDANWSEADIQTWISAGRAHGARVAFEPVSAAKSQRLFPVLPAARHHHHHAHHAHARPLGLYPRADVDLCTPNEYELRAMYEAAKQRGHLDGHAWFEVLDAFGIGLRGGGSSARDRFVDIASAEIADAGVPVQSIQLLPYVPTIVAKLGARGALLTTILAPDDPRLRDPDHARYVVGRCATDHPHVGGVYMRLFPAAERVADVVSVNGIGDTFTGVLVAGLAMGGKVERLIDVAQRAAVLTLQCEDAVSVEVASLKEDVRRAAEESR